MTIPQFPLLLDSRVGSIELAKHIKIPCQVTTLDYGDVAFLGFGEDDRVWNFAVERKTIGDLVTSMETGRFSGHQLIGLLRNYHVVYLLVEGLYKIIGGDIFVPRGRDWTPVGGPNRKVRFSYAQVSGFINTLQVKAGVKYWYTTGPKDSGAWITDTYYHWQKRWDEHKSLLQFNKSMDFHAPKVDLLEPSFERRVFKECKGIGWDRAELLENKFPTIGDFMNATVEDFMEVKGIGKVLAKSIYAELHK